MKLPWLFNQISALGALFWNRFTSEQFGGQLARSFDPFRAVQRGVYEVGLVNPGDVEGVVQVYRTFHGEHSLVQRMKSVYVPCFRSVFFVCRDNDQRQVVGYCFYRVGRAVFSSHFGARLAFLVSLAVDPDHQGQGLGRWLLEESLGFLRRQRIDVVEVLVVSDNAVARHLYHSLGFEKIRQVDLIGDTGTRDWMRLDTVDLELSCSV